MIKTKLCEIILKSFGKINILSIFSFLFFTVLIPISVGAEVQNDSISNKNKTVLYISGGAAIYGASLITNVKVESTDDKKILIAEKAEIIKSKSFNAKDEIAASEKVRNQTYKKVQEKINRKIKSYLNPDSSENELIKSEKSGHLSIVNYSNDYSAFVSHEYHLCVLKRSISKQKIYTSLSFLQFSKLLDSFLRGPPSHLLSV